MNREQKAAVVDDVAGQIQESQAIFAVDYRGITVAQVAALRTELREADATLRVVKNSLTELAADKAGAEDLKAFLDGPTAFTFVRGDAALAAKALAKFRKDNDLLEFKGGTMEGATLSIDEIMEISKLPSRDALNAQLVGVLAFPIGGLARTLNQLIQGLAVQLGQIAEQGLVSGDDGEQTTDDSAPAAEEAPAEAAPVAEAEAPAEEAPEAEAAPEEEAAATSENDEPDAPSEGDEEEKEG